MYINIYEDMDIDIKIYRYIMNSLMFTGEI